MAGASKLLSWGRRVGVGRVAELPYTGPVPPLSRPIGRAINLVALVAGLLEAAQVYLYLRYAGHRSARWAADVVSVAPVFVTFAAAALVGLWVMWCRRRRPRLVRERRGEAAVESPLLRLMPWPFVLALMLPGAVAGIWNTILNGSAAWPTAGLAHVSSQDAAVHVLWALSYLLTIVWVVRADRALDRRLARTGGATG